MLTYSNVYVFDCLGFFTWYIFLHDNGICIVIYPKTTYCFTWMTTICILEYVTGDLLVG
jgi:hypothetical protein